MSKSRMGAPKRVAVGLLAGALSVFGVAFAPSASAAADVDTSRLAGATRYGTSAAVSGNAAFDGATTAVVATGENFPDALAASALAGDDAPAPIVLTESDSLSDEAVAALDELGVTNVTVVGGTAAVSAGVVTALEGEGYTVTRVAGTTRYGTAAAIAGAVGTAADLNGLATAVIATGANFPDALAGGPLSYEGHPLLLVNSSGVPAETEAALTAIGAEQVVILGGTAVVSAATETALEDIVGNDAIRVAGTNRNGTAAAVGETLVASFGYAPTTVLLASGVNFPDALVAGPLGGELNAPIILTGSLPAESQAFLDDHSDTITDLIAIGGTAVIDDDTLDDAETAAETVSNDTPSGSTIRPELVSASIVETVTPVTATPTKLAGTYVRYTFDEQVGTTALATTANRFKVYGANRTTTDAGDFATVEAGNMSVLVRFDLFQTPTSASSLTVATVDDDATFDSAGLGNPEGDAPIGSAATVTPQAGVTDAPDLVSVSGFRQGSSIGTTAVDFTFDEGASVVANNTGFQLIPSDGTAPINCEVSTTPAASAPGGGAVPGGSGTTVITARCTNIGGTPDVTAGAPLSAANIARGGVLANAVRDAATNPNPPQIAEVGNGGNTSDPDLVSVTFNQGATPAANDTAIYTFDAPITAEDETDFGVYTTSGGVIAAPNVTANVVSTTNPTQVLVTYGPTDLDNAVGAFVLPGAVTSVANSNELDEVGVSNNNATSQTPGRTTAPDLLAVTITPTNGFLPATGSFTFDENLTVGAGVANTNFHLILADGTRLNSATCTVQAGSTQATATCTFTGTPTQIAAAVLGTVEAGAITEEVGGQTNVEGASPTTGGTGTPAS